MLQQILIFAKRIRHCAGFGVQSPSDYSFVRNVIYERTPFYAYDELDKKHASASRLERKLGKMLFRIANYACPNRVFYIGRPTTLNADYINAARHDGFLSIHSPRQLPELHDGDIIITPSIYEENAKAWHHITQQPRTISFDLYYVGISIYQERRFTEVHTINFY